LKKGKLIRLQLNASGTAISGDTLMYFRAPVRYRDIAISPDGLHLYLSTDSTAVTSGPSEENPKGTACKGCILEFTYLGGTPQATAAPVSSAQRLQELRTLVKAMSPQTQQTKRATLRPEYRPAFDLLLQPHLNTREQAQLQQLAPELLKAMK
jgi:hypothetical protein